MGARNLPGNMQTPWNIILRNGVLVQVWSDGRVRVTTTAAAVRDVEEVEAQLQQRFSATWANAEEYARLKSAAVITYGSRGCRAKDREGGRFFFFR